MLWWGRECSERYAMESTERGFRNMPGGSDIYNTGDSGEAKELAERQTATGGKGG